MRTMTKVSSVLTLALATVLSGCEWPPPDTVQTGQRGVALEHNVNRQARADSFAALEARIPQVAQPPAGMEPAPPGTFQNVQVLGNLSEVEFTITMNAITAWVAPDEGCAYCHVYNDDGSINYASDDIYTKVVSRRMLQMTQDLNVNWASHTGGAERGVNCWTCHQGNPLPTNYWFFTDENQPLRNYLDREGARVQGEYAIAGTGPRNVSSINQTVYTYQLMSHMSNALGVNCTYCHNTARFADWSESSPQRVTALRGLRMIRHANMEYMVSLQDAWPENRLGPMGDGPKMQCSTCHQGAFKPQWSNPASYAAGWKALTEIGYPNPASQ